MTHTHTHKTFDFQMYITPQSMLTKMNDHLISQTFYEINCFMFTSQAHPINYVEWPHHLFCKFYNVKLLIWVIIMGSKLIIFDFIWVGYDTILNDHLIYLKKFRLLSKWIWTELNLLVQNWKEKEKRKKKKHAVSLGGWREVTKIIWSFKNGKKRCTL